MIRLTRDYEAGSVSLGELVGELEGALDAGDFRDERLQEAFYDAWGPLEIHYATSGNDVRLVDVAGELHAMQRMLVEHLTEPERQSDDYAD